MNVKLAGLIAEYHVLLARSFVVSLGCVAIWWGMVEFPAFSQESSTERIASQIIAGDSFRADTLNQQIPIMDAIKRSAYCRPTALRGAAIIQLRMVEIAALANKREELNEHLKSLSDAIRGSLSCAPADPFLWLALYWVEGIENHSRPADLKYLRMSYGLGPNEGWIALKRNSIAFAKFENLPPDLAEITITEFTALLENRFYEPAAEIFTGPAWHVRNIILSRLNSIPDRTREPFITAVKRLGYQVNLPRSDELDQRPWKNN